MSYEDDLREAYAHPGPTLDTEDWIRVIWGGFLSHQKVMWLLAERDRLQATLDGDPHMTATPEQRRAWRASAIRYADKVETERDALQAKLKETSDALEDVLELIDHHGDRTLKAHATRLLNARKARVK